ncbi:MAG: aspartate aminotransferase family protein [Phycisphaeraceae bacterium]
MTPTPTPTQRLVALDHAHVWHPFTPMRQWRLADPLIIESGEGCELIDTAGRRYIDGVSSLWCNVHGHRVPQIDQAIRDQLDRIAHTTLLGLSHPTAIELAARLCAIAPGGKAKGMRKLGSEGRRELGNEGIRDEASIGSASFSQSLIPLFPYSLPSPSQSLLTKVFYSDAGATATEVAFKMTIGHWYHRGQPGRATFIAMSGAYHGDTTGAMSIGYSELFHRPYRSMIFHTEFVDPPRVQCLAGDAQRPRIWPLEDPIACELAVNEALDALEAKLDELGEHCAGVIIEPLVQGAAGMVMQPDGYLPGVEALCRKFGTLLIADEVATGFGRTGRMFACDHENVQPDILCLGKGITGGYLPLAATLATDEIAASFEGELHEFKTLYHGHTYTGNPLACAAAIASLDLFEQNDVVAQVHRKAELLARRLDALRDPRKFAIVKDVRQRGLMIGIELGPPASAGGESHGGSSLGDFGESPGSFIPGSSRRLGYDICLAARERGVIIRPLGDVIVLMPPLAITDDQLNTLADVVIDCIAQQA